MTRGAGGNYISWPRRSGQLEGWDVLFPVDWTNHGLAPQLEHISWPLSPLQVTVLRLTADC